MLNNKKRKSDVCPNLYEKYKPKMIEETILGFVNSPEGVWISRYAVENIEWMNVLRDLEKRKKIDVMCSVVNNKGIIVVSLDLLDEYLNIGYILRDIVAVKGE